MFFNKTKFLKYILHILFTFFVQITFAQTNLVPNGSFEEYDTCDVSWGNIITVDNWISANNGTPDFFSTCTSNTLITVPTNSFGYSYPKDGNCYMGLFSANSNSGNVYREFIECEINSNLIQGHYYELTFWVKLGSNSLYTNSIPIINACLSNDIIFNSNQTVFDKQMNFESNQIKDSVNWVKFSNIFKSDGFEKYLVIGNNSTQLLNCVDSISTDCYSYVYIDHVQLVEVINVEIPNVFTPDNDGINDFIDFSIFTGESVIVYNRWGNIVYEANIGNDYIWNGDELSAGVYFYVISSSLINKQGTIHLIR